MEELARSRQGGNTAPLANNVSIQSKNWVCTLFTTEPPTWNAEICDYLAYGRETCPTSGREHWQTFVCFKRKVMSRKTVQKTLHPTEKFFCAPMRGTLAQNEAYCSKAGTYTSFGTLPEQGARHDISTATQDILSGKRTADDFVEEDPFLYDKCSKVLIRAEQIRMSRQYRTEMTRGIWIWGGTGTGKSHYAYTFSGYEMEDIYTHKCTSDWWDFYKQQPCVVLNDFRGQIPYGELLQIVDKWPYTVERRYVGPIPFTSKLVIVTSPMKPDEIYRGVLARNDSIDQLLRRFEVFHIDQLMDVSLRGGAEDPPSAGAGGGIPAARFAEDVNL